MKVKHYHREYDNYKTERQWAHEGFIVVENAEGIELLPSKQSKQPCKYYKPDEVRKATKEQLDTFLNLREKKQRLIVKGKRRRRSRNVK